MPFQGYPRRVTMPDLSTTRRRVLAIQPHFHKGREFGVLAMATTADGMTVLADLSAPARAWEQGAIRAAIQFNVDEIVIGDGVGAGSMAAMCKSLLEHCGCPQHIRLVRRHSRDDMEMRARVLYAHGEAAHVGYLNELENAMGLYGRQSPDKERVEALILGVHTLYAPRTRAVYAPAASFHLTPPRG